MAKAGRTMLVAVVAALALAALAPRLPAWLLSLSSIAFANALVVLGLGVLWRAGLVSFGQALYYAVGAYAVALLSRFLDVTDAFALVVGAGLAAGVLALLVGFLLARYREISFAVLALALSIILYGALVKTEALGSTDGFAVPPATFAGYAPHGEMQGLAQFWLVLGVCALAASGVAFYFHSIAGAMAVPIGDNEIRAGFLGSSVNRLIHTKLVLAGVLGGVGGALAALAGGHVDPNMAYWTTSGGFVFITILAGASSVLAAFVGSLLFELVRSFAVDMLPGTWEIILGSVLLVIILFLPEGFGSLFMRRQAPAEEQPP